MQVLLRREIKCMREKCEGRKRIIGVNNRHREERRRKMKGHGENKNAVSDQGEHRMREGEHKMLREN